MKRYLLLPILLLAGFALRAQFTLVGDAIDLGGGCFQLADTVPPSSGPIEWQSAVWNNTQIDLNAGFDIKLYVSMTAEPADSYFAADGMAFVLQSSGLGALAAVSGNTMGYAHTPPGPPCPAVPPFFGGITPSIAVELDIFNNNGDCVVDGPDYDHVAVVQDGNFAAPLAGPIKAMASQNDISGAGPGEYRCREFRISYEPVNDTLKFYYNGVLLGRRKQDLVATVFGGNPMVYWGFTAATGFISAHMVVCTEYVDAGVGDTICQDAVASLNASGASAYTWSPTAGLSCTTCPNPTYTPTAAGTFGYQVTGVNFAGCRDVDSVYVVVDPNPTVDAGPAPSPICPGGSAALSGSVSAGGDFTWSPAGSLSGAGTLTPTASPLVTTMYYLSATDTVTGCSTMDSVLVVVAPSDSTVITLPDSTLLCAGDSVQITTVSTPGIDTYSWTPAGSLSSSTVAEPIAFPTSTTTYVLTASSSSSGCISLDSVTLAVVDLIASPLADDELCLGQQYCEGPVAVSGASGTVFFSWTSGGSILSTADTLCTSPPEGTSFYVLTVTDSTTGCATSDTSEVTVSSYDIQATPTSASINPGQLIEVTVVGGESWLWTGGQFNCDTCSVTLATSSTAGTVTLTVTAEDSLGCQATADITLLVEEYLVPNVFSPNGDGINDVVDLNYLGSDKFYEFTILDRWGNTLMVTNDPAKVWDGKTSSGDDAPEGVYFIAVRIIGDIGIPDAEKNNAFPVTLVR